MEIFDNSGFSANGTSISASMVSCCLQEIPWECNKSLPPKHRHLCYKTITPYSVIRHITRDSITTQTTPYIQDHFALRPQKRGGLLGMGTGGKGTSSQPFVLLCIITKPYHTVQPRYNAFEYRPQTARTP